MQDLTPWRQNDNKNASCCLKYFKRELPCQLISGYTYQSMGRFCDINAVILHLPRRFLCADPTSNWTQRVMRCVDERRKKKNFEKSTNITRATAA
ncbi:C-C motif chemokine 20b isoform X2 [Corythoichthys intestinalis]|uniref:C-C motif chemokine 20b isoform X2 n=1 Tax=Corythoichthys intestinalis TaxID=161448 RepID=UPI0025A5E282|nr:C-C motif chemokine 20b isoform X2 [Corythoichthys intestinalis]